MSHDPKKKAVESIPYRASEELFQALFEQTIDGIFIADQHGRYVEANRRSCEMLGYTREEILNLSWPDLIPAKDLARYYRQLDVLRAGKTLLEECSLRRKDGRLLPVEISTQILADGHFLGIVRDITERRKTTKALQESQALLSQAEEVARSGTFDWDLMTNTAKWSPGMHRLFEIPVEQFNGDPATVLSVVHPDDVNKLAQTLQDIIREKKAESHIEYRIVPPSGTTRHIWAQGTLVLDENEVVTRMIGVCHDITERKRAEEVLQKSHEELRVFFSQTIDGCFFMMLDEPVPWHETTDREKTLDYVFAHQHITQINDAMLAQYGATREQMLKLTPNDFFKHNLAHGRDLWRRFFDAGKIRLESDERKLDGTPMWIEGEYIVLYDSEGRITGHFGIQRVITERKQMEAERQAHLHFFESMDQINRAMQGTNDLEQMMSDVLDVVLTIFDCDRASLVHPCDPEAASWRVPMERTRPEYPGAHDLGGEIAMDPDVAQAFRILRTSNGPVKFGLEYEYPLRPIAHRFSVQCIMAMALYPKGDKPWEFVMHQCAFSRGWTPHEEQLFQEIGRRLTDALTSLMAFRNLCESEKKLAEAERIAHVGYWEYDLETDRLIWSDETYRILGLRPQERILSLTQFVELIHPEDRQRVDQAITKVLSQDTPRYDAEYRIIWPNGEVRYVHSQGDAMRDETGQIRRMFGTKQDITERRQVEDELRASEARFRTFVDHGTDAFFLHNAEGAILDVNRWACGSLGYTREELIGMLPYELDAEIDQTFFDQLRIRLNAGEVVTFDSSHRRKDGTVFPVEVRIRAFWHNQRRFGVSLVRDITERKQAQEALTLFRSLIDYAHDAIEVIDPETGCFLDVNEQACLAHGYTREEFLALTVPEINPIVAARSWQVTMDDLRRSGSLVRESQHRRKDGSVFPVEININYIRLDRDYVLAVVRDITERKQLEAENERLTTQFYQAQKMEAVGRLAGGIAHDFNNLLVPIIGYIELNLIDLAPDSKLYADLIQVRKAADRAADLTRQILAFSRQQVLELSLLDFNLVIAEFKKMLQRLIGEDIELQTFLAPTLDPIKADKGQLEQVLMNLAINSRDAMPTGGKLTIETANAFLDEIYVGKYAGDLMPGPYVMMAMSDTGHGIDAKIQKRIFDPFFTTKESGQGTGLGLATVFGIIKQHQGHVLVYSEPGNGTTFKIYLPKAHQTHQTIISTSKVPPFMKGTETVLVVEDEEIVRKLVCETLEAHGYDVIEAPSPADGLDLALSQATIHLLVTDVIMPKMNGKELYQKMRAIHPNSKVLYMSGYTNNVIVHHGILDEGINFLPKPFTVHHLTRKVREILD
ncbi:MAG: PAS domain S-box protein [Anaerolineae bacterium]|nr:PAS domain S-box protein [Anaerolineae bacterium]MCB9108537.1 PAS domain S-box protein [Anaerolineales bacterium]